MSSTTLRDNNHEAAQKDSTQAAPPSNDAPLDPGPPPDGGLTAWLTILGSALATVVSFGAINAFGVFQSYYTTHQLKDYPSSTISFIGAVELSLVYWLGPITGRIFDAYGFGVIYPLGSLLCVLSMMFLSVCQDGQIWQFFLAQALLTGFGNALLFTPLMAVVGHWFRKKRAFALGVLGIGPALGGTVIPIMLQRLIPEIGFGWAVRTIGFLQLAVFTVAFFLIKTRLPLKKHVSLSGIIDLHGFKDIRYVLAAFGSFLYVYGLFIPYFYIEDYGSFHNMSSNLSGNLLAILNATSIFARVIPGVLADKVGVLTVLVPCTFISGILTFALWLPSRGAVPITIYAALYGLTAGGFVSLMPSYVATISPPEKFGARLGSMYPFMALAALVGTPTAGAFVPRPFTQQHFNHLIIFTGAVLIGGSVIIALPGLLSKHNQNSPEGSASQQSSKTVTPQSSGDLEKGGRTN